MNKLATRTTGIFVAMTAVLILAFAMVMTVSAQSDDPDWRLPVTGLTVSAGDDPGELVINWDAHTQTTKTLRNYRVAWTPQGESFKRASQTDWNVYTTSTQHTVTGLDAGATYQVKVRTRYEGNQGSRWTDVVTGQTAAPPAVPTNSAATGQPTITGTVEVGETLTAATSAISDDNGLSNAAFNYQWVRSTAGSHSDISGATRDTYVITSADAESKIKVRVSFTDDDGYAETLTSASTASVPENTQNNITPRTSHVLVSNIGQANNASSLGVSSFDQAQGFTTGADSAGYALGSIDIRVENSISSILTGSNIPTVTIVEATPTGTVEATLTNPASITANTTDDYTFTAPANTTLSASTTYYVVMEGGLAGFEAARTNSDNEDSSSQSDWSIDNVSNWRSSSSNGSFTTVTSALMIQVNRAGTTTLSSDATLSDLELEGAGGETITLSPEFAQGTTTYTASVANRIDTVTLSATKNDANATVVITSDDDNATPGEAELDLSVGANALTVTVTAADASALTYTITATRATAPPAPTDCPTDTDWCTTLVLGYIPISSAQFTTEQFGYFSNANFGDLGSATFSHGETSYTVSTIFRVKATRDSDSVVQTDNITFTVSPELPDGTVLQLDTRTFTVDADSEGTSTGQEQWDIKADPPVWTDGQHVTVSLKLPSETVLVSNLDVDGDENDTTARIAQRFNTGQNPGGYTLTTVEVDYADSEGDTFAAMVCTVVGADQPTSTCTELTPPSTFTAGLITFTAPAATELIASTKYTLVLTPETGKTLTFEATAYDAEDSDSLAGWNIAGEYRYESGSTWLQQPDSEALQIRLKGQLLTSTLPALSFDNINITVDEDGSQAALSVELSQASAGTVTVDYATSDNTAEAGDDYTDTSGTLTFAPGETVKAIIVPILDDAIYEPLERFNVTLSNPTGATLPTFPGAQVNIAVDESPPTASIANVTVGEGAGTMTLTLNLSHESSRSTPYRTQTSYIGGTATQGADYENFLSGGEARITVPAGDTQASLDITITDDTAAESSETITIRWDNDPTGGNNGDATPATINFTGTITDNDSGAQLTIQDASADESSGSIAFRIDLSETITQDVTFDYTTSIGASDTAEIDDFDSTSATTHTLPAGFSTGLIAIDLNDDDLYEGDETFTVTISNATNASIADATATGTITDDETQPTLEIFDASATEGDDIIFLVDLIGPLTEDDITFHYATSRQSDDNSEADDFTRTTGTGTIAAGNSAAIITVPTYDDGTNGPNSLYEGNETFTFTIFNPTVAAILHATAKGTILDDEDVPTASFRTSAQSAPENSGTINNFIQFDIAPLTERSAQISLTITGTATAGQDYETPDTTLTLSPDQNQFSEPITITDDNVYELQEAITVQLVAVSDNIQIDPISGTKTLYIQDNDDQPVLSFDDIRIDFDETAGTAVLTVNKTGLTDVTARVDYATGQGYIPPHATQGEDYEATSGTLTFQPGETSKTILVTILDDNVYEQHRQIFSVNLDNPSEAALPPATASATIRIHSEDPQPMASMANVTASEPTGTMTLTLKLNRPSHEDISYLTNDNSEYRSGTATIVDDYEISYDALDSAFITVLAGQLTGTFDITLIEDDLEEPDETVELRWQKRAASIATPGEINFVGTITDDADRPRGPTNLTATADGANEIDLTWQAPTDIGTSNISGYKIQSSPNGTSNWTDLVPNTHRTITNYSDSGLAPGTNRYYRIRAINASGAGSASNVASATTADKTVSFGAAMYTASENGATARVTVELSAAVDVIIPIRVHHRDGASSADYSGVPRRLIFESGTTIRTFTVTAVDDSDNDDGEKIRIEFGDLPAVVGAGTRSSTIVKLKDNDGGNSVPMFDPANELRNLLENTAANQNVGLPITATDADGDSLTYTFSGPDMDRFTFISSTAQIRTRSGQTYDYETHQLFVVRVTADDGNGGTTTATVVIRVRDLAEPPSAPRLTSQQVNPTSMALSWTPPSDTGRPDITGYDVQYKKSSESAWTLGPQAVTDTNAALTGLEPSTSYYVQVRAKNAEGDSPWTSTLSRTTRSLSPGIAITKTSLTVTEGNTTTYFIVLGSQPTDSVRVSLSGYGSAAVSTSQNYHIFYTEDWNTPMAVTVTASHDADSRDKTVTIDHSVSTDDTDYGAITLPSLTVTIIDDDTPQVDGVSIQPGYEQLTVNWTAAPNATGYKLQWRRPGESYDTHTRLVTISSGSTTTYTIPDLTNLSTYEVRVAATRTGQNDGPWSEEITGTPAAP